MSVKIFLFSGVFISVGLVFLIYAIIHITTGVRKYLCIHNSNQLHWPSVLFLPRTDDPVLSSTGRVCYLEFSFLWISFMTFLALYP